MKILRHRSTAPAEVDILFARASWGKRQPHNPHPRRHRTKCQSRRRGRRRGSGSWDALPGAPPSSMHGARRVASDAAAPQGPYTTPRHTAVTQTYRGRGEHVSRSGAARGSPTSARAAAPRTASRGWPPPRPMDCTGRVALAGFPTMVRLSAERVPLWLDPTARSGGGPSMPSRPCWPLACHPTGREEANSVERHQAAAEQFRTRGPTSPARAVSVRTKKVKRSP